MSFWKSPTGITITGLDSNLQLGGRGGFGSGNLPEFYEIEPGVVLDIILDENHPYFKGTQFSPGFKIDPNRTPKDVEGKKALSTDLDYSWIGRVLIRLVNTQRKLKKEDCIWALPLESNISEYPLLNEIVGVIKHLGVYYYTRKINLSNYVNANPDFNAELAYGELGGVNGNRELKVDSSAKEQTKNIPYEGPRSILSFNGGIGWSGVLGRYFLFNERIRSLKRREGDLILESRFGQSIRFAAYDDNRENDKGYNSEFEGYSDYKRQGIKYKVGDKEYEAGCGNPMILIRNRQRPITKANKDISVYPSPVPPVKGTQAEKNTGGYILEDINNDGSSIHITSGTTISSFVTTCRKKMWGTGEEQPKFQGQTNFSYPKLMGDQIVINSDRIIISSKAGEMFHFSKKRMSFVTDNEFTVDAHQQIVINTNTKTVINSPAIYLGEYNQTNEPALLGQTTVNWLYDLCEWLKTHIHWYYHSHPDAGAANPAKTQQSVQIAVLNDLQKKLNLLMSRRVFLVGGGFAPGHDGGNILDGTSPVSIIPSNGFGVPGGWSGMNRKYVASDIQTSNNPKVEALKIAEKSQESLNLANKNVEEINTAVEELINSGIKGLGSIYLRDYKNVRIQQKTAQKNLKNAKENMANVKSMSNSIQIKTSIQSIMNDFNVVQENADKVKMYANSIESSKNSAISSINKIRNILNNIPNVPNIPNIPNVPNVI